MSSADLRSGPVGFLDLRSDPNGPPTIAPAVAGRRDLRAGPYYAVWGAQLGHFLRSHVREMVRVPVPQVAVSAYENVALLGLRGWRAAE